MASSQISSSRMATVLAMLATTQGVRFDRTEPLPEFPTWQNDAVPWIPGKPGTRARPKYRRVPKLKPARTRRH